MVDEPTVSSSPSSGATRRGPARGLLHAWRDFVRRYTDFNGRSTRPEFWWWLLTFTVVSLGLSLVNRTYVAPPTTMQLTAIVDYSLQVSVLQLVWTAVNFLGAAALTVRRLHDGGRSGWWWFVQLVPVLGAVVVLVLMALPTTARHPGHRW